MRAHRGLDTGPGHRGIDRIFPTITIGLMFPSAARSIAVDGGGMGRAMRQLLTQAAKLGHLWIRPPQGAAKAR